MEEAGLATDQDLIRFRLENCTPQFVWVILFSHKI